MNTGTDLSSLKQSLGALKQATVDAEKAMKKAAAAQAAKIADALLTEQLDLESNIALSLEGDPSLLQELLNGLKKRQFEHAAFFIINDGSKLHLGSYAGEVAQTEDIKAGQLIQTLAPIAGGKGGGKPDQARGAAPQLDQISELLKQAQAALQVG